MAHKKGAGSSDNGRDSISKRLGVKMFGGQVAKAGNITIRQRGTKFHAGDNVYMGRDHTLHAGIDGIVVFDKTKNDRRYVSVMPADAVALAPAAKAQKAAPKAKATPVAKVAAPKAAAPAAPAAPKAAIVADEPVAVAAPIVEAPVVEAVVETPVVEALVETPVVEAAVAAPVAEEPAAPKSAKGPKLDDLKIVEGIGPKIEQLLKDGGIETWLELSLTPVTRLQEILDAAGPRYQVHNPSTWAAQAKFAAEGRFEELKEYQDMLIGGRDVKE